MKNVFVWTNIQSSDQDTSEGDQLIYYLAPRKSKRHIKEISKEEVGFVPFLRLFRDTRVTSVVSVTNMKADWRWHND